MANKARRSIGQAQPMDGIGPIKWVKATLVQCPKSREKGWPIGSGMVERASKVMIETPFNGAGMHWERQHSNPILSLRNTVYNDRWSEVWHGGVTERAKLRVRRRHHQTIERWQQLMASFLLLLFRFLPVSCTPVPSPPPV